MVACRPYNRGITYLFVVTGFHGETYGTYVRLSTVCYPLVPKWRRCDDVEADSGLLCMSVLLLFCFVLFLLRPYMEDLYEAKWGLALVGWQPRHSPWVQCICAQGSVQSCTNIATFFATSGSNFFASRVANLALASGCGGFPFGEHMIFTHLGQRPPASPSGM